MEKVINILLVEDDQVDVMDIKRSLDKLNVIYRLEVASNGEDALKILNNQKESMLSSEPDVVLIDINMPRMNGLELLTEIRNSEQLKHLKCFIVTTSDEKIDKQRAKELGVSGFITKPVKFNSPSSMDAFNLMIDLMNMKG